MDIRDLRPLTAIVTALVIVDAMWTPVLVALAHLDADFYQTFIAPVADGPDLAGVAVGITTTVAFSCWIYLAGRNLVAAGIEDLEFTPAARIWWFAVPVAAFFKPFQGMRELWNASRGIYPRNTSSVLVEVWWVLWLVANFGRWFVIASTRGDEVDSTTLWSSIGADCALAVVALLMILRITRAQRRLIRSDLNDVFA